jgi:hypothetical protein
MTMGRKTAAVLVCAGLMWLAGAGNAPEAAAGNGSHHSQLKHVMNVVYRLAPHPNRVIMDMRAGSRRLGAECGSGLYASAVILYRNKPHGVRDRVHLCRGHGRWIPIRWTW